MKKFLKIIITNVLVIIFLCLIGEFICFCNEYSTIFKENNYKITDIKKIFNDLGSYLKCFYFDDDKIYLSEFRPPAGLEYSNKANSDSILLLGCSYTYGWLLKNEDSFHSVLSQKIKKTVYNLGMCSASPREMLYILRHDDIINSIIKKENKNSIKYVIYTYIGDHRNRLIIDLNCNSPHFRPENNFTSLKYEKDKLIYHTFLYKFYKNIQRNKLSNEYIDNLFLLYMKEIHKEVNRKFSNEESQPKMVLLIYDSKEELNTIINELKADGYIVFYVNDLTDVNILSPEYQYSEDDIHPNKKAWDVIVPALVKKLNI